MPQKVVTKKIEFDATGQSIGRLAVRVTNALRGKDAPQFELNRVPVTKVVVFNTDKLSVSQKRLENKIYFTHSGYSGGLREQSMELLFKRDSREVIRRAVFGMLPKNKLRDKFIANLKLYKSEIRQ